MLSKLSILAFASAVLAQSNGTMSSLAGALNSSSQLSSLSAVLALPGLTELVAALTSARNVTLLAPSNEAFASIGNTTLQALTQDEGLLTALLQYHVLDGTIMASDITNMSSFVPTSLTNNTYANVTGGQVVEAVNRDGNVTFFSGLLDNSTVTQANINFTGGVIHVIDRFLVLPEIVSDTLTAANLTSLRGALNATDLLETANTTPDLTIFAPSSQAFSDIGSALANASTADLTNILKYHVVNGTVGYSSRLDNGTVLTAMDGNNLTITFGEDGRIFVNNARITIPNILVANGVVHVIDEVLNPANATVAKPSDESGAGAFSGATSVSDVPFTSGQPTATTTINQAATDSPSASTSKGAAGPMKTGSVGMGALLGAAAVYAFN